jgi:peptidyl-prolyl cis-trans isomerase B (cyclophilin B)
VQEDIPCRDCGTELEGPAVAASKNAERDAREARERLRRYNARQSVHSLQVSRRRRDNVVAIVGVVVIAALATLTQVFYFTAGPGMPAPSASASPAASASPSASPAAGKNVGDVPAKTIAEDRTWTGDISLNDVKLGISLDGAKAPQATSVFIDLAKKNFYTTTGATCHRLTNGDSFKLIQCGSVDGKGAGDVGFSFGPLENVPADGVYPAGTIAMARGDSAYSQSSQFFITYADTNLPTTTGGYTIFGKVTSGLPDFVSRIADAGVTPSASGPSDGAPVVPTKITQLTVQ